MKEKSQYKTITEWRKANPSEYQIAKRKGWLDELRKRFGWKQNKLRGSEPIIDNLKESIFNLCREYKTKRYWKYMSIKSYKIAMEKGWMDECEEVLDIAFQEWSDEMYMNL